MSKINHITDKMRKFLDFFKEKVYTQKCKKCYNLARKGIDIPKREGVSVHSIFDVANYILQSKGTMTTMKLQKLCYYVQAWSLAWDDKPMFNEDFQAWANGPVSPDLFATHKGHYVVDKDYYVTRSADSNFTATEKETLDSVLAFYGDKEPQWLSSLTHNELPWRLARGNAPIGASCSNEISKDSMQEYYGGLH